MRDISLFYDHILSVNWESYLDYAMNMTMQNKNDENSIAADQDLSSKHLDFLYHE